VYAGIDMNLEWCINLRLKILAKILRKSYEWGIIFLTYTVWNYDVCKASATE